MDYACINDIDIGDVLLRNNEKYVCISTNHCQDEYYSLIYIIKETEWDVGRLKFYPSLLILLKVLIMVFPSQRPLRGLAIVYKLDS